MHNAGSVGSFPRLVSLSKIFSHTCFIHEQGCKWWSRLPKMTSSVISDVKPVIHFFTFLGWYIWTVLELSYIHLILLHRQHPAHHCDLYWYLIDMSAKCHGSAANHHPMVWLGSRSREVQCMRKSTKATKVRHHVRDSFSKVVVGSWCMDLSIKVQLTAMYVFCILYFSHFFIITLFWPWNILNFRLVNGHVKHGNVLICQQHTVSPIQQDFLKKSLFFKERQIGRKTKSSCL